MDIFLAIVVLTVLAVAIISGQTKLSGPKDAPKMQNTDNMNQSTVSGQTSVATPSGNNTPPPSPPVPTLTSPPTSPPQVNTTSFNISNLRYPNSTINSGRENSLYLTSNDNPDTITDWYKQKIVSLGANSKSFVTTKANDKILNKLVGSNGRDEIRVEIKKDPGSSSVQIVVEIKSS